MGKYNLPLCWSATSFEGELVRLLFGKNKNTFQYFFNRINYEFKSVTHFIGYHLINSGYLESTPFINGNHELSDCYRLRISEIKNSDPHLTEGIFKYCPADGWPFDEMFYSDWYEYAHGIVGYGDEVIDFVDSVVMEIEEILSNLILNIIDSRVNGLVVNSHCVEFDMVITNDYLLLGPVGLV